MRPAARLDELGTVLDRIRAGDREAAGELVIRFGPLIRRRVRGRLHASVRSVFDSEDVLSTVARRLDSFVKDHRCTFSCEGEFWSLLTRITEHSIIDKTRAALLIREREPHADERDELFTRAVVCEPVDDPDHERLALAIDSIPDVTNRRIVELWLMGLQQDQIAAALDLEYSAVRKRLQRTRDALRAELGEPFHEGADDAP